MSAIDGQLSRDGHGVWTLTRGDTMHCPVSVVRAYPLSAPDEACSVLDAHGHELVWIESLADLPEAQQASLRTALAEREFTPVISAILGISSISTPSRWTVRTDRGITDLLLPGEEALQRVGRGSLLVADAAGVQYLIRDIAALDRPSRKLLERFL